MTATRREHDYILHLLRYPAEWCAWLFAKTPITPNQVTVVNFVIFVPVIIWFIIRGDYVSQLIAFGLIGISVMLDMVDGSLARRKGLASPFGHFLDTSLDNIFQSLLLVTIVAATLLDQPSFWILGWGLVMLFGQNMANIWGNIYNYEFGFNGYSGNKAFAEQFNQLEQQHWYDRSINNCIVPVDFVAIVILTARFWIIVGILTHHLDWMLIGFGVTINFRWVVMWFTYLRLFRLKEREQVPRWPVLQLLNQYWLKAK